MNSVLRNQAMGLTRSTRSRDLKKRGRRMKTEEDVSSQVSLGGKGGDLVVDSK